MWCAACLMPLVAFIAALLVVVQSSHMPPCLADCLKNATTPCDDNSLAWLFTCLNDQCPDTASVSGIKLTLTPKAEYSCQDSLIPGTQESYSPVAIVGDASCATSPYIFKSFIPSTGTASEMDVIAQQCKLRLFPAENCTGDAVDIDVDTLRQTKCEFHGGRGVRLSCEEPWDPAHDPLQYLGQMCTNGTSTSSDSSSPTSYGSTPGANTTVHIPSIYSHVSGSVITAYATGSSDQSKTSLSPGLASNEQTMKASLAALVTVVAASIVIL